MASSAGTASKGPRYAPPDPTLPKPWRALIDGNTGYLYFWNPETKAVQYERPAPVAPPPVPAPAPAPSFSSQSQPPGYGRPDERARSSAPSETHAEAGGSYSQNALRADDRARMNFSEPRSASGPNPAQNALPTGQVSQAANGNNMSPEAYRAKHEITILGNEAPAPFMTFHSTGFPMEMLREFQQAGFSAPTPIQAQSWPIALKGRDIVAVAKTGSGKTLGYLLPGFMLLKRLQQNSREGPTVLVLSPTRELATQIQEEAIKFGRSSRISSAVCCSIVTCTFYFTMLLSPWIDNVSHIFKLHASPLAVLQFFVIHVWWIVPFSLRTNFIMVYFLIWTRFLKCLYGGASKGPQLRDLERGADVVVATPGRLNDILEMNKVSLRQVAYLVLDEADRMLDMGFEPQIRKIVKQVPPRRQTLMYTATWPKEVRKIAADFMVNPIQVNIGNTDQLVANKSITQHVEVISHGEKSRRLEQILRSQEPGSRIIIFCSTKRMCDQLARNLSRQYGAAAIHGDKSQPERDSVLSDFRNGRCPVLVATDVAARGLDVKDIRVVVNYDFPTGVEDYVHRIGRTGRAGATGSAYTFFGDQDAKYASDLVKILEGAGQSVPSQLKEMALRGGYGGRSRRWASSDDSYGGQGYGSGYAKRSTDSVNNSSFSNTGGGGSSFHSSFDNSSRNYQTGGPSASNDQSGGGLSWHERFYGSGARDQSRSNNDGYRARSRSPPSKAVGVSNW